MKKYILMVLCTLLTLPFLLAVVDLYFWFWFDHKLTSIDWEYNTGIRTVVAFCLIIASVAPLAMLSDTLRDERIGR